MNTPYTRLSLISIFAILLYAVLVYLPMWTTPPIFGKFVYDAHGYYDYLPAAFIYHDLKTVKHNGYIKSKYNIDPPTGEQQPTGGYALQYSCGQAVMELPWFALAHLIAKTAKYDADGYSKVYEITMDIGMMLWCFLGIFVLWKVLKRYFEDLTVAITLFGLTIGTNYLSYATFNNTYTHSPLFTVYALLIWATIQFYEKQTYKNAAAIGALVGLAMLTRPTEVICIFIPLLWGVFDKNSLIARINLIKAAYKKLTLAVFITIMIGSLQLFYWKHVTGHFFFYSYGEQSFHFLSPYFYKCLFSSRKGWITYSPIVLIALIGFYAFWRKTPIFNENLKVHRPVISLVAFLAFWITFSWDIWWYGGGIGQRAMIQYLPLYAFPFAACTQDALSRPIAKWVFALFVAVAFYHNIWVFHGATKGGYINTAETNDAYFFNNLWRWTPTTSQDEYLLDNPENNATVNNPKIIYKNDFESDTTANATKNDVITGKTSWKISAAHRVNEFSIPIDSKAKTVRVTATIKPLIREWDPWNTPLLTLRLNYKNTLIKSNTIKIHRGFMGSETKQIQIVAKAPNEPIDNISIVFDNQTLQSMTIIDDIIVECGY